MAGIYIHIPFCKQACSYCNFHFSTNLKNKSRIVQSIIQEIKARKAYVEGETINTIYFGGGTPSLLEEQELITILDEIAKLFPISTNSEITLEANPDDLTKNKLLELKNAGINRLSIGVQSFHDIDLRFMNRAHNSIEAMSSIKLAQDIGFKNISIDLIFGSQTTTDQMWEENLSTFFKLEIPHLSSYSLTIEEKTALNHQILKGKLQALDEDKNYRQYLMLQSKIDSHSFDQYELSNYCKNGLISMHNSSYWNRSNYLGIGPSAHSHNKKSRQWNISNNSKYITAIENNTPAFEIETLSHIDAYHDYLITRLRTKWGIQFEELAKHFPTAIQQQYLTKLNSFKSPNIVRTKNDIKVKRIALFQSDEIVRALWLD